MKKRIFLFIRLGLLLALVSWALVSHRRKVAREKLFSGTLEYTEHLVGVRVPGRLSEVSFDEGESVTKGQVLARLDRWEQVKRDLDRAERLHAKGGVADQALEEARLALQDQEVRSPVDGVVLSKVRQAGEVAAAGGAVAVVGEDKTPFVRVYVPEDKLSAVRVGQAALLRFDGLDKTAKGRVVFISPKAEFTPRNAQTPEDRATLTFAVKIAPDGNDPALKPGLAADVSFE
jgi:HlyD family secretion protein